MLSSKSDKKSLPSDTIFQIMQFLSLGDVNSVRLLNKESSRLIDNEGVHWHQRLTNDFFYQTPCTESKLYDAKEAMVVNATLQELKETKSQQAVKHFYSNEIRSANHVYNAFKRLYFSENRYQAEQILGSIAKIEDYIKALPTFSRRYGLNKYLMSINVTDRAINYIFDQLTFKLGTEFIILLLTNYESWIKYIDSRQFYKLYQRYLPQEYASLRKELIKKALRHFDAFKFFDIGNNGYFLEFMSMLTEQDRTFVFEYLIVNSYHIQNLHSMLDTLSNSLCFQIFSYINHPALKLEPKKDEFGDPKGYTQTVGNASLATAEYNKQKKLISEQVASVTKDYLPPFLKYLIINKNQFDYICELYAQFKDNLLLLSRYRAAPPSGQTSQIQHGLFARRSTVGCGESKELRGGSGLRN